MKLSERELNDLLFRLDTKLAHPPMNGGVCAACGKLHSPDTDPIRGYASGNELDLCAHCAGFVNTEKAIREAELLGAEIKCERKP